MESLFGPRELANVRLLLVEDDPDGRELMTEFLGTCGIQVVGAASIVDRSGGAVRFDVPYHALLDVALPTYEPDKCPLCSQGLPVVKPGSRAVA